MPGRPASPPKPSSLPLPESVRRVACAAVMACVMAGCGRAAEPTAPDDGAAVAAAPPATIGVLCASSGEGYLRARLQGAIVVDIDWTAPVVPQCLGGPRPGGDGLRLVYKGPAEDGPLLVVIGIAGIARGVSARHLAANVTLVREGSGAFYSTQGDDKCAIDELTQEPVTGHAGRYRLTARGYCTQPARALGAGAGAVLVTRFDAGGLVDFPGD
jgi:hypothetical protein